MKGIVLIKLGVGRGVRLHIADIAIRFGHAARCKAEFNYMDFGTERILVKSTGIEPTQPNFDEDIGRKVQVVKVGLNYKFDWAGPLVGRY